MRGTELRGGGGGGGIELQYMRLHCACLSSHCERERKAQPSHLVSDIDTPSTLARHSSAPEPKLQTLNPKPKTLTIRIEY